MEKHHGHQYLVQVVSTTSESFENLERECCNWRDMGSFRVPVYVIRAWQRSIEVRRRKAGTGKGNLEHGSKEESTCTRIYTTPTWAGTQGTSLLWKGFGGACLGHLNDLHRGDAFAGHTVSGAQLVQSSFRHAGPLLRIIQLMDCLPVASQGLVGLLLLQQRHSGEWDVNLTCSG